jgi:hypothetical protein
VTVDRYHCNPTPLSAKGLYDIRALARMTGIDAMSCHHALREAGVKAAKTVNGRAFYLGSAIDVIQTHFGDAMK